MSTAANLIVPTSADADYANSWANPAAVAAAKDPLRIAALVMAGMSVAQGDLITTLTANVTKLTKRMAGINEVMKLNNDALARFQSSAETDNIFITQGSEEEMKALVERLKTEGVSPLDVHVMHYSAINDAAAIAMLPYFNPKNDDQWGIYMTKKKATSVNDDLRLAVDTLSTTTQDANLSLQNLLSRYNLAFDSASSFIKKAENQAETIASNTRK